MKLSPELLAAAEADSVRRHEPTLGLRDLVASNLTFTASQRERFDRRRLMLTKVAVEPLADAFERIIGGNDLLPINYLQLGHLQSKAVGRISYRDRTNGGQALATGFLISESLILTNHHVFPVDDLAGFQAFADNPRIEFNFELDLDGNRPDSVLFELDPAAALHTCKPLDMAVVGVRAFDTTGRRAVKDQGYLVLNGERGMVDVGDFASIIQHPDGREKQIAIRENKIVDLDRPDCILYVTDTAVGSSGAPVFNDQWQVIALHSAGQPRTNEQGQYVDAHGEVIELVDGGYDETRLVWESNRGMRISSITGYLRDTPAVASDPHIQALFSPDYSDSRPFAFLSRPNVDHERKTTRIASALETPCPPSPVTITISIGADGRTVAATPIVSQLLPGDTNADFTERYEDDLDFSDCAGFDDHFMGQYIPMPIPTAALLKKLAPLVDSPGSYTLKYPNFSTLHHAVRRVPIVSGINVPAALRYPQLDGTRVDHWYRDKRIDKDVQLDNAFYTKSGFDRGHLARREDAEWGASVEAAQRAANMTCSYANAIPQVPALNRARYGYHGAWGQLEMTLLEKGVEGERGKSARICVFNGPLFNEDDPQFKGVQVALNFYKVVLWYDAKGKLKTTCYTLSQEKLVGQIDFVEVLRFDEVFKTSQVPIHQIQDITGLTFHSTIVKADTSTGKEKLLGKSSGK